ncbi:MAG: serine/threonine-protein phosphatase [Burkholderiaceae bacterium]|nr:serine/threonine-protein phosphatase [Burkholderiaceae bacterium]
MKQIKRPPISVQYASVSDIGGRKTNQDDTGIANYGKRQLFVVSDGAGGHAGGAIAARLAVEAALIAFQHSAELELDEIVMTCLHAARRSILTQQVKLPDMQDMTATIVIVVLDLQMRKASVLHLGDSRLYAFRRGRTVHITRDHSLVQGLIDVGMWPAERLLEHPQRSVLYGALGSEEEPDPAMLEIEHLDLRDGDALLLCSDGWWESVSTPMMEHYLMRSTSAQEWITQMLSVVQGPSTRSRDNSTAIGVWLGEPHRVTLQPFGDTVLIANPRDT